MNVCLSTMIRNPGIGVVFGGFSESVSEFLISGRASDPEGAGVLQGRRLRWMISEIL